MKLTMKSSLVCIYSCVFFTYYSCAFSYEINIFGCSHVGTAWQKVNGGLTYVSVSPAGSVWGVNKDDDIWFLEGTTI